MFGASGSWEGRGAAGYGVLITRWPTEMWCVVVWAEKPVRPILFHLSCQTPDLSPVRIFAPLLLANLATETSRERKLHRNRTIRPAFRHLTGIATFRRDRPTRLRA